jgi:hypothetical protein
LLLDDRVTHGQAFPRRLGSSPNVEPGGGASDTHFAGVLARFGAGAYG